MFNRIRLLTRIEICNLFGINQRKYAKKDNKSKKEKSAVFAYIFLYIIFGIYSLSFAISLSSLGLAKEIPTFNALIVSAVILFSTIFEAGTVLFNLKSYERLAPLPFKPLEVVISRFLHLYLVNIISAIVFFLPPMIVCGISLESVSVLFVVSTIFELILASFLPTSIAILLSTLIMLITSKMKHRTVFKTIFSMIFILAVFTVSFAFNFTNDAPEETDQIIESFKTISNNIKLYFLPSGFFYRASIENSILDFIYLLLINIVPFMLVALFVSLRFVPLCQRLNMTRKEKAKKIENFSKGNMFQSLFKREMKRFFSSSLYVTNSGFGYVMLLIIAIAFAIVGKDMFANKFPDESYVGKLLAIVMLFAVSMTSTTACSISMEGKNWWISQSLPIDNKTRIHSKLAVNYVISLPFYLISIIIVLISLESSNPFDYIFIFIVPLSGILFSSIIGLKMNIKYPLFDWNNEAEAIKQSKSVGFLMLIDTGVLILIGLPSLLIPGIYSYIYGIVVSIVLILIGYIEYKKMLKFNFINLN